VLLNLAAAPSSCQAVRDAGIAMVLQSLIHSVAAALSSRSGRRSPRSQREVRDTAACLSGAGFAPCTAVRCETAFSPECAWLCLAGLEHQRPMPCSYAKNTSTCLAQRQLAGCLAFEGLPCTHSYAATVVGAVLCP
jgi:hypothetical protein